MAVASFGAYGRSHDAIVMKNFRRQQSMRGKVEGKVDNDCKDKRADNAG